MIKVKKPEMKTRQIATKITESDYRKLEQISKRHGMKIGGYLRALLNEQIKSELNLKLNVK